MININKCPLCESDEISLVTKDHSRKIKGNKFVIPDITFYECSACGELFFPKEAMQKMDEYIAKKTSKQ